MRTKKIVLYYHLTQAEIFPPSASEIKRKDDWVAAVKAETPPHETQEVKVTYELHNPAVARQRRYFNGPVIDFYIIQNENLLEGKPTTEQRKLYRETILFDTLGYTVELKDRKIEQRKSTSTFTDVQKWHTYLEELRETHFEPNGYEMPDTEQFWALEKKHGMQTAADITIHSLQRKLKQKLSPPKDKD